MKRKIAILMITIICLGVFSGCKWQEKQESKPPKITVKTQDGTQVHYYSSIHKWNGETHMYGAQPPFIGYFKEGQTVFVEENFQLEVVFEKNPPKKIDLVEHVVDQTGDSTGTSRNPVTVSNSKVMITVKNKAKQYATKPEQYSQGYVLICEWDSNNQAAYAFGVKIKS